VLDDADGLPLAEADTLAALWESESDGDALSDAEADGDCDADRVSDAL
jgi:hypothetical protein